MSSLPRHLPPSVLIREGARDAQVAHALVRLTQLYLKKYRSDHALKMALSDEGGPLHRWLHGLDCGTVGGWEFGAPGVLSGVKADIADASESMERLVGWTEENEPR